MRLRTITKVIGFDSAESTTEAKVQHSQKRTYKGAKIASIQNKTEFIQLGGIDKKDANKRRKLEKRAKKRECYTL